MRKKTVRDIDVSGKRVLMRVDYNVPMDVASGRILDDKRIRATLPTLDYLRLEGARVVLLSHLGRPKGKRDPSLSLAPVAARLAELMGEPVQTADDCIGTVVQDAVAALTDGDVLLLENVRFHPEEEANEEEFAKALASLGDVFVNDAFGVAHRASASTEGVAHLRPAVAGFLMESEINFLSRAVEEPERPYAAIIGGAKVSSKMAVIEALLERVDKLMLGGGMANTFLKAEGFDVAESLVEDDYMAEAKRIEEKASERGVKLLLPADVVVAERFEADSPARRVSVKDVPAGWRIMDVGETTIDVYAHALAECKTVVWNGPMGVAEMPSFAHGSHRLAGVIAKLEEATTIIGGGETAAVVESLGMAEEFSHVSTGGGASLEFLEGRELPGVAALQDR
ncbi:MAG: phosphoglycerate kinase [Chloroflexi bacterium]|nr:phosphoglycerate kinase [Chloroflexota bacterium]MCI0783366.1 phosphoglycerate kinase [Chloroflexota bacterium]MCI0814723.1 phosphoglycerate kinase [Chloroflexota bacterium]MCI0819801.1 phosphoglycerate kinase [Chloroflexota bacterium]MCI0831638.1 phosphoglycerate kinase [Chloroflexota bacterium]